MHSARLTSKPSKALLKSSTAFQIARIFDHFTWSGFGVIQGGEHEELVDGRPQPATAPAAAAMTGLDGYRK